MSDYLSTPPPLQPLRRRPPMLLRPVIDRSLVDRIDDMYTGPPLALNFYDPIPPLVLPEPAVVVKSWSEPCIDMDSKMED